MHFLSILCFTGSAIQCCCLQYLCWFELICIPCIYLYADLMPGVIWCRADRQQQLRDAALSSSAADEANVGLLDHEASPPIVEPFVGQQQHWLLHLSSLLSLSCRHYHKDTVADEANVVLLDLDLMECQLHWSSSLSS